MSLVVIPIFAIALAACGGKSPEPAPHRDVQVPRAQDAQERPPAAATAAPAMAAVPSDPKLAKVYAQTCKACHTAPGTGAPQAGDRNAWQPRLAQGMPVLLTHTVDGYKGMPPLGSCMDCTEAEFEALIKFMSGS